ncbi:type I polyketide synthase [Antrihabitans stalagmiti]|nr:type I polyketide synthase [Antrihabitans stalagmiti]
MTSTDEVLNALRVAAKENSYLQNEIATLRRRGSEPIAIVGVGCRYPGGVDSRESFWDLVANDRDVVGAFPNDRGWNPEVYNSPSNDDGKSSTRSGGFLYDAADFDAGFFGISPREALASDPQQRVLLEVAWEALEDAGIDPTSLRGSATGVFAGVMHHDYAGVGGTGSLVSGRISYVFGLEGPAVSVDTACSSSLVAVHQAVQSLRSGECDLALAGGVTVLATPWLFVEFTRQRALSADGRCKSFSDSADGVGWGEGAGLVVLERLSDAVACGRRVLGVVRGSAVNQDGASNGLTAPNGPSQERVIRSALASAGLVSGDVDVVEGHGTGTALGDPIEAQALLATYGQNRENGPVWLGSVKSNMGHTQAAAGVAGVIKVVEAMRRGVMPASLFGGVPSSHVDWSVGAVRLLGEARVWESKGRPRRAGVSSFGISGTNAHVIVEEAPPVLVAADPVVTASVSVVPWVVSGRSADAVVAQSLRLRRWLDVHPDVSAVDVGVSLAGRAQLPWRAAVVDPAGLEAVVPVKVVAGKTVFVFSGQGAQSAAMGRELFEAFPVFADAITQVCDPGWLFDSGTDLDRTDNTQLALFAVEVALCRLLESWGVIPDVVVGHSIGEIAAAHVAGVLDLADAVRLVTARGALMAALPAGGAMLAVEIAEADIADLPVGVSIAGINSRSSVTVSGPVAGIEELEARWSDRRTKRLAVSHAFHSALMDPMLAEFAAVAQTLTWNLPRIALVSTVTGQLETELFIDPGYWVRQVREPVRFADGISAAKAVGGSRFVEVGPDAQLSAVIDADAVVAVQRRGRSQVQTLVRAVADAHCHGVSVEWARFFAGVGGQRVDLPSYAFQRQRYWQVAPSAEPTPRGFENMTHPFLGAAVALAASGERVVTGRLSTASQPWLADHVVFGSVLLPGSALVELACAAGGLAGCARIEELVLESPVVFEPGDAVAVQVSIAAPDAKGHRTVVIYSSLESDGEPAAWVRNAAGSLSPATADDIGNRTSMNGDVWPPDDATPVSTADLYAKLNKLGYEYGPTFQCTRSVWRRGDAELWAEVELVGGASGFGIHPAILDAAFHAATAAASDRLKPGQVLLPFVFREVQVYRPDVTAVRVAMQVEADGVRAVVATDAAGLPVWSISALDARGVTAKSLRSDERLFAVDWLPVVGAAELPVGGPVWGIGDPVELGVVVRWFADVAAVVEARDLPASKEHEPPPVAVVLPCAGHTGSAEIATHVDEMTNAALLTLQDWLAADMSVPLLVVTNGAVAMRAGPTQAPLAQAAVWGLVRSAQLEFPGRFVLIDVDADADFEKTWPTAVSGLESQLLLRDGRLSAPRLVPIEPVPAAAGLGWDADGSVLITGGGGALGAVVARHLASEHGIKHLVLASRRGAGATGDYRRGAEELTAELTALGAQVRWVACDVSDRESVASMLAGIDPEHPLTAVVHTAGVLDDGVLSALTPDRMREVLAPKAVGAWHLHELTRHLDLAGFVLFSSVAGTVGAPGQANYAAANAYLDALAEYRRSQGLQAISVAWGLWDLTAGMAGSLDRNDRARMNRNGLVAMSSNEALELFELALTSDRSTVVAARFDRAGVQAQVTAFGSVPPMLRGFVRSSARAADGEETAAAKAALVIRLSRLSEDERSGVLSDLVRGHVAAVLGHPSPDAVDPDLAFQDLGFDSLAAVEFRNRLANATGVTLAATVAFDHPTPKALATHLISVLSTEQGPDPLDNALEALAAQLDTRALGVEETRQVVTRLRRILARIDDGDPDRSGVYDDDIRGATEDELFDLLDGELG